MSTQTQTQTQTKNKSEKRYIVVPLEDLQVEHFSFGKPKSNAYGGLMIPIRYMNKILHVKYPKKTLLFGVSSNRDKGTMTTVNGEQRGENEIIYGKGGKITGYSASFSVGKEYETDPCFLKLQELDEFFMNACVTNCVAWRLGGTSTRPLSMETVAGYDEFGQGGKWKRLLKYSYVVNQGTQEREYREYPPNFEVAVPANIEDHLNEDGKTKSQSSSFYAKFFDQHGNDVGEVTDETVDDVCPSFSEAFTLARWARISQGTYGASLKPRASQFRVYPKDDIDNSNCMLGGEDDEDEDLDDYELTETLGAEVVQTAEDTSEEPVNTNDSVLYTEGDEGTDAGEVVDEVESPKKTSMRPLRKTIKKLQKK
jgi:hypothetical protein